jgi:hypothetical protein
LTSERKQNRREDKKKKMDGERGVEKRKSGERVPRECTN